jgi:hypothetical protein
MVPIGRPAQGAKDKDCPTQREQCVNMVHTPPPEELALINLKINISKGRRETLESTRRRCGQSHLSLILL